MTHPHTKRPGGPPRGYQGERNNTIAQLKDRLQDSLTPKKHLKSATPSPFYNGIYAPNFLDELQQFERITRAAYMRVGRV